MKEFYENLLGKLKTSGIEDPESELLIMISKAAEKDINTVLKWKISLKNRLPVPSVFENQNQMDLLNKWVDKRAGNVPLQYITGTADFYGYSFKTAENVLIPRFDTEISVDVALKNLSDGDRVLDLCCGTGCIGITLALKKDINVTLADISKTAIEISKQNIALYNLQNRVSVIYHNLKTDEHNTEYDMIISNPPYIKTGDIQTLSKEVQKEPSLALDGGFNGLDFYNIIAKKYKNNIKNGGFLIFECGLGQYAQVMNILKENDYADIEYFNDYNSIERVVCAKNKTAKAQ